MKTNRRRFLQASAATAAAGVLPAKARPLTDEADLDGFIIAKRHQIIRDLPTPNFFEGMLLGNGDIGLCVTVRPDALALHLGKEDSWDIRVSEDHYQHVLPFNELLKLWERASEEAKRQGKPDMLYMEYGIDFFREYTQKVTSSYAKSWPRPWPCGIVWIHWDSRKVRVVRQVLDPSNGLYYARARMRRPARQASQIDVALFRKLELRARFSFQRRARALRLNLLLPQS